MGIGILGGTFDPVHIGHLVVAEEAGLQLGFREVIFVPTGQPWLKVDRAVTASAHRVEMVRRAIADNSRFSLSTEEVERGGPTYTVDTLAAFRRSFGSQDLYFIMGQDSFADLPLWKDPERLVEMCRLVVVPRLGRGLLELESVAARVPRVRERVVELDAPVIGISSSDIRRRVSQGLPVRYLVPEVVEQYIREHRLYEGQA